MRNGHGKEVAKGADSLPQEQRGLVGPARVAEGGKDDNRRGGKMVSKNKHRVVIRDVNIVARAAALTISTCSLQAQ
jgi:hypothetical protein